MCQLHGTFFEIDIIEVSMTDKNSQQKGKAKTIIRAGFGRDDLSQSTGNEFVGEWPLSHGLRKDWIRARNARSYHKGCQKGELGHGDQDAQASADPHNCHYRKQTDRHLFPVSLLVACRELKSCDNQLNADDDATKSLIND
ncbi:hypothetical protein N0V83_007294 [Neocucurbitaria cava]|uniref:Uncharacterized protein n=1 Tax=Neocucurbitaria cava TaxID=798079 RepID=A0A9W9CJW0_9PLEO|nr:hypothetical protein N0V83_007294 [Neocucurbitaria cava]